MRERAARIHSKLTIVSSLNAGTEVTLLVPGTVVYCKTRPTRMERLKLVFRRLTAAHPASRMVSKPRLIEIRE